MSESDGEKQAIRDELNKSYEQYTVNKDVAALLREKTFTGLAGPFGVGKTTLTDAVLALEPTIQPILTTTTRHRKPEDPTGFKTADEGVTFTAMRDAVRRGELVNYSVIPGGDIYGTYPEDFPAEHTIGPFLPTGIDHISRAGFDSYNFVYVVTAGDLWRQYVEKSRNHLPEAQFKSRVTEAVNSIEFAIQHPELLYFVDNQDGEQGKRQAAQKIARIALGQPEDGLHEDIALAYLEQMHAVALNLKERHGL